MKCEKCGYEQETEFIICPECYFNNIHDKSILNKILIGKWIIAISILVSILIFIMTSDVEVTIYCFGSFFLLGIIMIIMFTNERKRIEGMRINIVNRNIMIPVSANEYVTESEQLSNNNEKDELLSSKDACKKYADKFFQETFSFITIGLFIIIIKQKHPSYLAWGLITFAILTSMYLIGYIVGYIKWRFNHKRK